METTTGCGDLQHCPNQWCGAGANATAAPPWVADPTTEGDPPTQCVPARKQTRPRDHLCYWPGARIAPSEHGRYNTLVWAYEWPKGSERAEANAAAAAVPFDAANPANMRAHRT